MKFKTSFAICLTLMATSISCSGKGNSQETSVNVATDSDSSVASHETAVEEKETTTTEETRTKLAVASAFCGYQLGNQAGNNYDARNMTDGNPATAWAMKLSSFDDMYENGILVGPVFELAKRAKSITGVEVQNGYCKNEASFKNNTRAAWITIYRYHPEYDGEYGEDQEAGFIAKSDIIYEGPIKDSMEPQYFPVRAGFDNSQPTRAVGLLFKDGKYNYGRKWKDLCLSEINIYGE